MTSFADKALLCSLYDQVVNAGQLQRVPEFIAPDFVGHLSGADRPIHGPAEFSDFVHSLRSTFPDLNSAIDDGWLLHELDAHAVGKGVTVERLAARVIFRGTQSGWFRGNEATGSEVQWAEGVFAQIENGRIASITTVADSVVPVLVAAPAGAPA